MDWKIGDPIEVQAAEMKTLYTKDSEPEIVWLPATVCGLKPLTVAFSDGDRLSLHSQIPVRNPRRPIKFEDVRFMLCGTYSSYHFPLYEGEALLAVWRSRFDAYWFEKHKSTQHLFEFVASYDDERFTGGGLDAPLA